MTKKPTDRCSQCGKQFKDRACGPTHALIFHEAKRRKKSGGRGDR